MASWERWDACLIPWPAEWVKDLVLVQLWLGSRLLLRSDPRPRNSTCLGVAKNEKNKEIREFLLWLNGNKSD